MKTFNELRNQIAIELEKLNWENEPRGLYEPISYLLSIGGKRVRPVLTMMACNLFSDDLQPAVAPALGIEVFHNFTLLHDDIMDRADIRRGLPTVHKKWNDNTAILSGDVMLIVAYQLMVQTPTPYLKEVLDLFSKTAAEICEGQQYDVDYEARAKVEIEEYIEMIRLKTAVLLGCALKTGAIIGNASPEDANLLYECGINIGLAFQLKDDMLDVYGDEATFGKKIGGDILCNKKTYLLIQALECAQGEDKVKLNRFLEDKTLSDAEKIKSVTLMYDKLGVKKKCEDKLRYYYEMAIANLDRISVSDNKKQELRKLAEKLLSRND